MLFTNMEPVKTTEAEFVAKNLRLLDGVYPYVRDNYEKFAASWLEWHIARLIKREMKGNIRTTFQALRDAQRGWQQHDIDRLNRELRLLDGLKYRVDTFLEVKRFLHGPAVRELRNEMRRWCVENLRRKMCGTPTSPNYKGRWAQWSGREGDFYFERGEDAMRFKLTFL